MNALLQGRRIHVLYLVLMTSFFSVGCDSKSKEQSGGITNDPASTSQTQLSTRGETSESSKTAFESSAKRVAAKSASISPDVAKDSAKSSIPQATAPAAPAGSAASATPINLTSSTPFFAELPKAGDSLDLLAVATVSSLDDLERVMSLINGAPKKKGDIAKEAVADFKKKFGFKDASWLRKDAPMFVILSDIKEENGGRALVFPIQDSKAFQRAIKGLKKKGSKHLGELVVDGKKAYLDAIGNQAVMTYTDDFFARLKPYLEGAFKTYKAHGLVELRFNVQALRKMYGKDLSGSKSWIKKNIAELMGLEAIQGPSGQSLEDLVNLLQDFIESVSEASVALTLDNRSMSLLFGVVPEKGKTLERMVKSMAELRSELAFAIHPNSFVTFGGRADSWTPEEAKAQGEAFVSRLSAIVQMEAQETAKIRSLFEALGGNQTGDALFQIYRDEAFPAAIGFTFSVKDAAAERKAHQGIIDFAFKILMKKLKVQMKDNRMASLFFKSTSFAQLFGSMAMLTNPMGLGLEVSSKEIDGTTIDALTIKMDWKKSPLTARMPNADMVQKIVGDSLSIAAAYRGRRSAIAFGPQGKEHAQKMVEEKGFGAPTALTQILKEYAVAGEVRVGAIAKLLLKYSTNRTPPLLALSAMGEKTAVQFRAKSNGSKATFRVTVPAALFRAFR